MKRLMILAALAFALTGCGATEKSHEGTGWADTLNAQQLADHLSCTGGEATGSAVSCEANGTYYGIHSYKSRAALAADVKTASQAGASVLVGYSWYIDAPSASDLEYAKEKLGGKLVTP